MASKKAVGNAYARISANCPLAKKDNENDLNILLDTWLTVFSDLSDLQLAIGVRRFLTEITEVNRSMVLSAKLRELALPKQIPFNENKITDVVKQVLDIGLYDIEGYKSLKQKLDDPIAFEVIEAYGLGAIRSCDNAQLPIIHAQLRNDYRNRWQQQTIAAENERLKLYEIEAKKALALEDKGHGK